MNKKRIMQLGVLVSALGILAWIAGGSSPVLAEQDLGKETQVLAGGQIGDVDFPHRAHQENLKDCNLCHKLFPKKEGAIAAAQEAGTLKPKKVMNQCRDCHRKLKKQGEKHGPTSCRKCHNK